METVEVAELGKASIITLMIKQIMDRNLLDPRKRNLMRDRMLTVHVRVREMFTTVFFESTRIRAEDGVHGRPDIEIRGDMQTLLAIALGASPFRALWNRRLGFRPRRWRGLVYALRLLAMMQLGPLPAYLRWLGAKPDSAGSAG
jgi:hypothetical protein